MQIRHVISWMSLFAFLMTGAFVQAGVVRTKDTPQKGGGYHDEGYHLKGRHNKEGFVNKEHNWRNPFKGFTKGVTKDGSTKDSKKNSKKKKKKNKQHE